MMHELNLIKNITSLKPLSGIRTYFENFKANSFVTVEKIYKMDEPLYSKLDKKRPPCLLSNYVC